MILYRLRCDREHEFEAWFRDAAACDDQRRSGLLECPICGSSRVEKAPMAPRIGKSAGEPESRPAPVSPEMAKAVAHAREMRRQLRAMRARIEESCAYVGPAFAEEARKIHYGETDPRGIYGEATREESAALKDEGVAFSSIPWVEEDNA